LKSYGAAEPFRGSAALAATGTPSQTKNHQLTKILEKL
jgi:hypothetical protein